MEPTKTFVLALDQGTTSSRTVVYDLTGAERFVARRPIQITHPSEGWVEQDPEAIWRAHLETIHEVFGHLGDAHQIVSAGITNQRETVLAWNRLTGEALTPAVVWQCRRSDSLCARLRPQAEWLREETGLVPDPYFSGTKIQWLLENTPGLEKKVQSGDVVFGTIDSWLLFRLTEGRVVATEPSNASRTMCYSLKTNGWSEELTKLFGILPHHLPEIRPSSGDFGAMNIGNRHIPITAVLGDQQASLYGHGGLSPGSVKCTFGTGAFLLLNVGAVPRQSQSGLLGTVAWSTPELTYALEGSVFIAGALVQWLRDKLGIFQRSEEIESLARSVPHSGGVVVVPAFVGLGAPYWDDQARGTIFGLTRDAGKGHIARAALEAVAHQVADLFECPEFQEVTSLSIDGGMAANALFCQILAEFTQREVVVAPGVEMTAFGAARLSLKPFGLDSHFQPRSLKSAAERTFSPSHSSSASPHSLSSVVGNRLEQRERWRKGVERSRGWV